MTSFLPHRWRAKREATRHAEAIAGILDTAPIRPKQDGLVLFSNHSFPRHRPDAFVRTMVRTLDRLLATDGAEPDARIVWLSPDD